MRILLSGATGAMGKVLAQMIGESKDLEVACGVGIPDGKDYGFPIFERFSDIDVEADLCIDFSSPKLLPELLPYCLRKKKPLVLCTTGFTSEEEAEIQSAAEEIPLLHSGNMSLGVNLLVALSKKAAAILKDFDVEIVETHHRRKKDSPSGTAIMLGRAIEAGRDQDMTFLDGRTGRENKRTDSEIGFHAVRGGTVTGKHEVLFLGEDEEVHLVHSANSRRIFATGALAAARFLIDQPAGFYTMNNLFDL